MGFTKRYYEYCTERGMSLSAAVGENVCTECFSEAGVKARIRCDGSAGRCDFCGKFRAAVADLAEVIRFIEGCLRREYADPAERLMWCGAEGGYQGATYSTAELLDEVELDAEGKLRDAIEEGLGSDRLWCDDDPGGGTFSEQLASGWSAFAHAVQHESRFFALRRGREGTDPSVIDPEHVLDEVASVVRRLRLFRDIPAGTELHRVRVVSAASTRPASALAMGPPTGAPKPNRMSPAGISMFYVALTRETAVRECPNEPDARTFAAVFRTKRATKVIDLTAIPPTPTLFDTAQAELRDPVRFLRHLSREITKPIERDDRAHVDYIPSQLATEHLRLTFEADGVEGIMYPSARHRGGRNIALFAGPEAVVPSPADAPQPGSDDWLYQHRHRAAWLELLGIEDVTT